MPPVILFDGVCNLCNFWVKLICKYDKQKRFRFASLQSNYATRLQKQFQVISWPDSVILYQENQIYVKADAVMKICSGLGGLFRLAYLGYLLPRFWRNAIYNCIAKNRYRWFGRQESCMVPTPELNDRFLTE
jgi:predicted DCC family thiol-disulfide oxidoreductase YuxK